RRRSKLWGYASSGLLRLSRFRAKCVATVHAPKPLKCKRPRVCVLTTCIYGITIAAEQTTTSACYHSPARYPFRGLHRLNQKGYGECATSNDLCPTLLRYKAVGRWNSQAM